jgi:3-carboxy-cis,cis-muconate cycloisomerase
MVSAFDSSISSTVFADEELSALFSDEAEIQALVRVEKELAKVQVALGIIPQKEGKAIVSALDSLTVDPAAVSDGFKKDGIPIPALLRELREYLGDSDANFLHWGATSQDIMDTALVLRIKSTTSIIESRISSFTGQLVELAEQHRATIMVARTRNQNAAPTVFGLKVVNWFMPLVRQRQRLSELLPRLLRVQLGGAVGTNAALGSLGMDVNSALAKSLELHSSSPWHVQRDAIVEFANWLAMTAGIIAKMAQDMLLMAQSEVAEISFENGGKSSTMPNKSNPVLAESIVALANFCRTQTDLMQQALHGQHERDGIGMSMERLVLGPLVCAAGACINLAQRSIDTLNINQEKMLSNLEKDNGQILAEAAVFELCAVTTRENASKLVANACQLSAENQNNMIDELSSLADVDIDWEKLKQPANYLGVADEIIDLAIRENNSLI